VYLNGGMEVDGAICEFSPIQLECGPVPNVMAALSNIGGALCSTPQSLAHIQYWSAVQYRCQDAKPVEICRGSPNYRTDLSR